MKTDTYQSSKGPRLIADMPHRYLANAITNLQFIGDPDRADELESMIERRDALNKAYAEREAEYVGVGA